MSWAVQYADVVLQSAASAKAPRARDSTMAVNVNWVATHTGGKVVAWMHNLHARKTDGGVGAFLAAHMPTKDIASVGFALGEGPYLAYGQQGLANYPAIQPPSGSVEYGLRTTGLPLLILDLRRAQSGVPRWINGPLRMREIGALASDGGFLRAQLNTAFDFLIYVDRSTSTTPISVEKR